MFQLRPYQQEAVQSAVQFFRRSHRPAVVVLPTGSGKSLVIAELARIARGRVLVLAHVKELVEQNHAKYEALAGQAGIYSAGLKRRETQDKVVFGSIQSVARHLDDFDEAFSLLIIDECHRISQDEDTQYQLVLKHLLEQNEQLKTLGLTATPYRMGIGWIYEYHAKGQRMSEETRFFDTCVYELTLRELIRDGYLTQPLVMSALAVQYHFGELELGDSGAFEEDDLLAVLRKSKRATPKIIEQVKGLMEDREAAMIFASTVAHAKEIMEYLPEDEAALILGSTPQIERDRLIQKFKQKELRYMVNVSVLTTGFDAPHVDLIALLRPTESISLFQQIVGRGLRLSPGKTNCLILDYAGNGYDLYAPEVGSPRPNSQSEPVEVICPQCGFGNTFWGKVDADGALIEHYGRKCQGVADLYGERTPCDFRFRFKSCEHCNAENDIAARQCHTCDQPLIDPDKKLREVLGMRHAKVIRCGGMQLQRYTNKKGGESLKVTYYDEDGAELTEYFKLETPQQHHLFYHKFIRMHHRAPGTPLRIQSIQDALRAQMHFRHPDFVVAYKDGTFWSIREKLFDYAGRFRKANEEY